MNLCINARDAMGGVGILTVRLRVVKDLAAECLSCHQRIHGQWVELSISDTGTGIEADIMPRLFDPFFTTKEVGKGTGMGLAVIHGIMKRLGGHILVDTRMGKGSTFRLLFPPVTKDSAHFQDTQPEQLPAPKGEQRRILVLDDEPALASFIGDLLVLHGYQVSVKTNGVEALEVFMENPSEFSLLVTDQTMPGMTGVEVAKRCREIRPGFPIILCTGFSEEIDKAKAEKMDLGFIEKPIDTNKFLRLSGQLISSDEQR